MTRGDANPENILLRSYDHAKNRTLLLRVPRDGPHDAISKLVISTIGTTAGLSLAFKDKPKAPLNPQNLKVAQQAAVDGTEPALVIVAQ
jgi:hypothetical protein